MTETRKEYADLRLRQEPAPDKRFRGMARIPAARRWLLRKYEAHKTVVENESASEERRAESAMQMRTLHSRLQRMGVFKQ